MSAATVSAATSDRGLVVWFTGLSGAGKTTISAALAAELRARNLSVEVLDGDEIRAALWPELGFSRADRDTSVARMANLAARFADHGLIVLVAAISPYAAARTDARASIGADRFVEVWATCSLETLAARDVKGLYKKAAAGEIARFTGVSDPYEPPKNPDVVTDSGLQTPGESLETVLETVLDRLPEGATK